MPAYFSLSNFICFFSSIKCYFESVKLVLASYLLILWIHCHFFKKSLTNYFYYFLFRYGYSQLNLNMQIGWRRQYVVYSFLILHGIMIIVNTRLEFVLFYNVISVSILYDLNWSFWMTAYELVLEDSNFFRVTQNNYY